MSFLKLKKIIDCKPLTGKIGQRRKRRRVLVGLSILLVYDLKQQHLIRQKAILSGDTDSLNHEYGLESLSNNEIYMSLESNLDKCIAIISL